MPPLLGNVDAYTGYFSFGAGKMLMYSLRGTKNFMYTWLIFKIERAGRL